MPRTYTPRPRTPGKRPKTGGRRKGSLNRTTVAMREAMLQVFARMQATTGRENGHFLDWALGHSTDFYKLSARLIPHQVAGEEDGPVVTRIELVAPDAGEIARLRAERLSAAHEPSSRKLTPPASEDGKPPACAEGEVAIAAGTPSDGGTNRTCPRRPRAVQPFLGVGGWML